MRKTDIELINEILNGNHVLFEEIVERYQSSVFVIALGFVQNREDAEDIAQEVMVNIFCNLNKFKGDSLFSTWVYRIAVNGSLDFLKKTRIIRQNAVIPWRVRRCWRLFVSHIRRRVTVLGV